MQENEFSLLHVYVNFGRKEVGLRFLESVDFFRNIVAGKMFVLLNEASESLD